MGVSLDAIIRVFTKYQPFINRKSSIVNRQLLIVNCQLSIALPVEDAHVFLPGAYCHIILFGNGSGDLVDVRHIVHDPGSQ